ncbi:hypothetical protein HELRODRAFT_191659, partial [Helobdella robusta]|uniref:TAFII55 protein conserved region domain-containing protein n=1 Tax=Helobdella robusta TaxID=6412 RepID=T1FT68_HELRO
MTSKRREDMVDLEQQFILRLPLTAADNLKKDLQIGGMSLKDKLSLEIHPETRRGKVVYDSQMYNAKLVDLPCIVESYKTTDRKTFYKCADISQMLMCKNDFTDDSPDEDNNINNNSNVDSSIKKKEKDKRFLWNHGLCPPLKNVRKRRFRRTLQKKHPEQPDIERELRRLFSMDAQAIDVKWEIIYEQEKPDNGTHHTNISSNTHIPNSSKANKHNNNNNNNAGSSGGNRNKNSDGNNNN